MKIPQRETHYAGRPLWTFPCQGLKIQTTVWPGFEFGCYFINGVPVTDDDLIICLADFFDNDEEKEHIKSAWGEDLAHAAVVEDCKGEI